jgi:hypothetical protein
MTVGNTKHWDALRSFSTAPGYRDVSFTIRDQDGRDYEINLGPANALSLWRDIGDALRLAWRLPEGPTDKQPGETRPRDLIANK